MRMVGSADSTFAYMEQIWYQLIYGSMEDNCSNTGDFDPFDNGPRYTIYTYRYTIDVLSIGHIIIGTLGVVLFIVEVNGYLN